MAAAWAESSFARGRIFTKARGHSALLRLVGSFSR